MLTKARQWYNEHISGEPGALPMLAFVLFVGWLLWSSPGYPTGLVRFEPDGTPVYCGYQSDGTGSSNYSCTDDE